ncbi:MAG: DUF2789 domain-containing protein [Methyloversatilis discipulorum]|uniref:DUF2789 domain-containing protein n=1 Tax=Methyloversatilis TaxID=378210 RepID=UPI0026F16AC0|nr:DUF2789 domain-containing protein [Methyloversatilis discipulorum]MBT9515513.1 DUF2789 domain-containing protein [Methyloversatilis discipulorum]
MDITPHSMEDLFDQLGLPSDPQSIEGFIALFGPIDNGTKLHEATFWSPAQAAFLRDALNQDADWSDTVDSLNAEMHAPQGKGWRRHCV